MFCNFNFLEVSIFCFVVSVDLPCGRSFPQVICIFGLCVSFPWWPCLPPHPYSIPSGFWKCLHSVVSFICFCQNHGVYNGLRVCFALFSSLVIPTPCA